MVNCPSASLKFTATEETKPQGASSVNTTGGA